MARRPAGPPVLAVAVVATLRVAGCPTDPRAPFCDLFAVSVHLEVTGFGPVTTARLLDRTWSGSGCSGSRRSDEAEFERDPDSEALQLDSPISGAFRELRLKGPTGVVRIEGDFNLSASGEDPGRLSVVLPSGPGDDAPTVTWRNASVPVTRYERFDHPRAADPVRVRVSGASLANHSSSFPLRVTTAWNDGLDLTASVHGVQATHGPDPLLAVTLHGPDGNASTWTISDPDEEIRARLDGPSPGDWRLDVRGLRDAPPGATLTVEASLAY